MTLGRYRIVREIARSNDIVYEAIDPRMGRRIALKELQMPPNLVGQQRQERVQRFYREAKAAGSLTHPNVVTIHEVGEDGGRHFIAMEYLEGESLRDRLRRESRLPVDEALRIAIAVANGLDYAHQHGVIHRDVKPDNVHLLTEGGVKLMDFGIARITFEPTLTADGQIFGTPSYMSPEQVRGKGIDARTDIFSLGVMLYEMVSGQKPFTGDSVITITYNIMNLEPAPVATVPKQLDSLIRRAMAKDPAHRYASAGELARALEDALLGSAAAPPPTTPAQLGPPPPLPPAPPIPSASSAPRAPIQPRAATGGLPPAPLPAPGTPAGVIQPRALQTPLPGQPPPLPQRPILIPDRPRQPLLTPGQRQWVGVLVLALVIGVFALGIAWMALKGLEGVQEKRIIRQQVLVQNESVDQWNAAVEAVSRGYNLQNAGQLRPAEEAFREGIRIEPRLGAGHVGLGSLALNRNAFSDAVQYFEQGERAWMEFINGGKPTPEQEQTAIAGLERAREHLSMSHYNWGQQLEQQGQMAAARDEYFNATKTAIGSIGFELARARLDELDQGRRF